LKPEVSRLVMVNVPEPVLVTMTGSGLLLVPTVWLPNARLVVESETAGDPGGVPVPLSVT